VYRRILPLLLIGSITITYADSAIQTDWSGGSGVWGPVTEFGIDFYFDSGMACYSTSGDLALGMIDDVVPHNVVWEFEGAASVYSEDIDGDGDMDILGAAYGDNEIAWWEVLSYPPEGALVSSVLDVECSPVWGAIGWSSFEPAETSVGFQIRSSVDPDSGAMGPWSDTLYVPCSLEGILTDADQYVQYMVILETSHPDITPALHEVMLTWDPLGIPGDIVPNSFELLPFHPNPTTGSPLISFAVPELSSVELFVFDISGRLIESVPNAEYSAGYHSILISDLSPGIYFCRMISGDFIATRCMVII